MLIKDIKKDIKDIVVGERRREDLGDVTALAKSIQQYGLLQPIVVDAAMNLVAGERRLSACLSLGWERIEVQQLGDLSMQELRLYAGTSTTGTRREHPAEGPDVV